MKDHLRSQQLTLQTYFVFIFPYFFKPFPLAPTNDKSTEHNLSADYRASLTTEQLNEYQKVKDILIRMNKFCITTGE